MAAQAHSVEIARCCEEQEEILRRPDVLSGESPAWLALMGWIDWEIEKQFIERETCPTSKTKI